MTNEEYKSMLEMGLTANHDVITKLIERDSVSLRDRFATHVLSKLIDEQTFHGTLLVDTSACKKAYRIADAMLKVRDKKCD